MNSPSGSDRVWWYYHEGQTQGPHTWEDILSLVGDGSLPPNIRVSRSGDTQWRRLNELLEEPTPSPPPPLTPVAPAPVAYFAQRPAARALTPTPGLGAWISQGWQMVTGDFWPFVGAALLVGVIGLVSLGICVPPLQVGLFLMCLKKYDGRPVRASDVFQGFQYFGASWGLALLMAVVILVPSAIVSAVLIPMLRAVSADPSVAMLAFYGVEIPLAMLVWTVCFFSLPLIADGAGGAIDSIRLSWDCVRGDFLSYLGTYIVIALIASAGVITCYVGALFTAPLGACCWVAAYRYRFPGR